MLHASHVSQFSDFEHSNYFEQSVQEDCAGEFPNHTNDLVWWVIMIIPNNRWPGRGK